jgi:hypothetical protein
MRHQISEARKLAELRALTDRQLTELITNRLERGFELAARPDCGTAEHRREVTRLVSEIVLLLPAVSRADRIRLQSQLANLEDALTFGERMQAAS